MAVAAEAYKQTSNFEDISGQEFGRSLATVAEMGRLMCRGASVELDAVENELWQDFVTGVQENVVISDQLVEDPVAKALRERLQFSPMRTLEMRDGKTVTNDGRTMESLCENGVAASKVKAAEDERMQSEVERSENDVWVTRQVDSLQVGEMLAVVSMEPLEAMDRDGDTFWKEVSIVGYTRGLAVLQVYYRDSEHSVRAGAYSVKGSSKAAFRQLLAEHGTDVALDTPANDWITKPIRKQVDAADAEQYGAALHDRYQQIIGRHVAGISVTELMQDNEQLVRTYFNVYMKALAQAHPSEAAPAGANNDTLRDLASAVLAGGSTGNTQLFSADDRRSLVRVANSRNFGKDDALFMEKIIRYACGEELWNILLHKGEAQAGPVVALQSADTNAQLAALHGRAASRVRTGVALGRSGGGCSGLKFDRPEGAGSDDGDDDLGQQDTFGGNANKEDDELAFDGKPKACAYTHDQCYCSPYDDFSNPIGVRKMVVAYRDRKGTATCLRPNCGACIDGEGKVLSYGGIFELAQKKQQQIEVQPSADLQAEEPQILTSTSIN